MIITLNSAYLTNHCLLCFFKQADFRLKSVTLKICSRTQTFINIYFWPTSNNCTPFSPALKMSSATVPCPFIASSTIFTSTVIALASTMTGATRSRSDLTMLYSSIWLWLEFALPPPSRVNISFCKDQKFKSENTTKELFP